MRNKRVDWDYFQWLEKQLGGVHVKDQYGFYRHFTFTALGEEFKLEYYKNLCTVYHNNTQIKFTHATIDGCWPNRYKNNVNLGSENDVYAVIPIQEYDNKPTT